MALLDRENLAAMKAKREKFRLNHVGTKLNESELAEFMRTGYSRIIGQPSLRTQLHRLKADGILTLSQVATESLLTTVISE